jgi:hypothetical protein
MHVTSTETKVNDNSGDDGNAATSKLPWMKFFPRRHCTTLPTVATRECEYGWVRET